MSFLDNSFLNLTSLFTCWQIKDSDHIHRAMVIQKVQCPENTKTCKSEFITMYIQRAVLNMVIQKVLCPKKGEQQHAIYNSTAFIGH